MQWKIFLGLALLVLAVGRLVLVLLHFETSSYGVGQLVGGIVLCIFGFWLILSGRRQRAGS